MVHSSLHPGGPQPSFSPPEEFCITSNHVASLANFVLIAFGQKGTDPSNFTVFPFPMELTIYFSFVLIFSKLLIHGKATVALQPQSSFKSLRRGTLLNTTGKSKQATQNQIISLHVSSRFAMPSFLHTSNVSPCTALINVSMSTIIFWVFN